jgi:hypothetical protein
MIAIPRAAGPRFRDRWSEGAPASTDTNGTMPSRRLRRRIRLKMTELRAPPQALSDRRAAKASQVANRILPIEAKPADL